MVGGKTGQTIAAQPVGARIPDMQQVGDAAAQHQRGEGAPHSRELGVLAAQGIDPAVERTDDLGARSLHLHGLGQIAKSIEETAHRGLGRGAAALCAADSIGDRRDHFLARLGQFRADTRRRRNPRCPCAARSSRKNRRSPVRRSQPSPWRRFDPSGWPPRLPSPTRYLQWQRPPKSSPISLTVCPRARLPDPRKFIKLTFLNGFMNAHGSNAQNLSKLLHII